MDINLLEVKTGKLIPAIIKQVSSFDLSELQDWNFDWANLGRTEGAYLFKVSLVDFPSDIQGIIMLSIYFEEMTFMNNLEVAPWNIGKDKKYDFVAGALIAYGCRFSFENGKSDYQGFLTFESKSALVQLYIEKYGAKRTLGLKMYIDPDQGQNLISQYLEQ